MNKFYELNNSELHGVNGGGGALIFVGGIAASFVIDGVVTAATGKSTSQHIANGINFVARAEKQYGTVKTWGRSFGYGTW